MTKEELVQLFKTQCYNCFRQFGNYPTPAQEDSYMLPDIKEFLRQYFTNGEIASMEAECRFVALS